MPRRKIISRSRFVAAVCVAYLATPLLVYLVAPLHAAPPVSSENNKAAESVRTALKTEADQGTTGDRRKLLAEVVERSPDYAPARWQSGYLFFDGKWRTPDEVQAQASADPRMQQYQRLRAEATATVGDQIALAQWCRKNKLEIEERFHWLKVLEAEPNHPEALSRLRLRWIGGWLLTPEQHEKYLALRRKVDADIKTWKPRVTAWQRAIERGTDEEKQAALEQSGRVTDPAAVVVFEWSVRSKDLSHKALEYRLAVVAALAAIKNQPATEALVRIAATATEDELCDAAADALKSRPIPSYAAMLLAAMVMPLESEFMISDSGGSVYYQHRFFRGGAEINDFAEANAVVRIIGSKPVDDGNTIQTWNATLETIANRNQAHAGALLQATEAARSTEMAVARQNQIVSERNQRLKHVLTRSTGIDLPANPERWWNWWQDYNELYVNEKPLRSYSDNQYFEQGYATAPGAPVGVPAPNYPRHSCFVRGTPVWTLTGKKPIESIQVGDRVLSQNPVTGELAYMPVLRTTVGAPVPTVQIALPGETLTATRGHNFWSVGSGWAMTKNLKTDSTLYAVPLNVAVQQVTESEPAQTYNLIVAEYNTYFVGENRILTHDITLPTPSTHLYVPGISAEE